MDQSIDILLANACQGDDNLRSIAEGKLKQLHDLDLSNFLLGLSSQLSREETPEESSILAGIILKNSLDSGEPALDDLGSRKWLSLDPSIQSQIKENLLLTLESNCDSRRRSSKIIAKVIAWVACIEIPRNQWEELIGKLVGNMSMPSSSLKQATLEVLEYVFEEIPYVLKEDQVDAVLASVINEVKMEEGGEPSSQVRLAALKALLNILKFIELAKLEEESGSSSIVAAVCDGASRSKETKIKEAAFECLVVVASRYHTKLLPHMEIIVSLTVEALKVKEDEESLRVQCIELWNTICRKEINCREEEEEEEEEDEEGGGGGGGDSIFIGHLCSFVQPLLEAYLEKEKNLEKEKKEQEVISMSVEEEGEEEGDDNLEDMDISVSAEQEGVNLDDIWEQVEDESVQDIFMTCLGLATRTMKDKVVPLVMKFVHENINGPSRMMAIYPLGFILEGPSVNQLAPVVPLLVRMMEDPQEGEGVRGRAAWILGRVFELVGANRIIKNEVVDFPRIMTLLIKMSKDVPQVSIEVYGAIYFIARGYREDAKSTSKSSELTPFVKPLIDALLSASELVKETPFRIPPCASTYKALSEIVRVSNIEELEISDALIGLMSQIFRRLSTVVKGHGEAMSSDERKNCGLLEVLHCGLLELSMKQLGRSNFEVEAAFTLRDSASCLLLLLCRVLTSDNPTARARAALAIGALAHAIGCHFGQHMPILLQYFNVKRLSPVYIGVMCSICHILGKEEEVVPSWDHIMEVLYKGIQELSLQPSILSSFGEIAVAIGDKFEKYVPPVLEKLREAEAAHLKLGDEDHGSKVRESIFKAYHGMMEGINDPKCGMKVGMALYEFIEDDQSNTKRRDTSVAMAGVDALSLLPMRVGAWSERLIVLMKEGFISRQ
ncbi:hypothetical protein CFC21_048451 [Triticum aestivum]|uniref:Importin N-terminal domain-containing protein n=2 Tax=Triticum aestivum TaxID=4565 RepID=A0A3B6DFI7_WHEAT|nr:importin subunit beta-1-like [Triticum aestivum]XP_044328374.1 importin subunit beta-1-like [Triticum aestivum]KAF7038247.1 hypothetical protein CFC21_048451 [Triticum aestivum]